MAMGPANAKKSPSTTPTTAHDLQGMPADDATYAASLVL
jgi:hypothetical protein